MKKFVKTQRFCSMYLSVVNSNLTRKMVTILWLKNSWKFDKKKCENYLVEKIRVNATVLRYLTVDNFNLTRKSDAKPMMCFGVGERLCRFLSSNDTLNCSGSLLFLKRGVGLLGT